MLPARGGGRDQPGGVGAAYGSATPGVDVGVDGEMHAHALVETTEPRLEGQERLELGVGRVRDEVRPRLIQLLYQ